MSVINLNTARKVQTRAQAKQKADENARTFGRTKAERLLEAARASKAAQHLDAHQFDDD